MAKLKLKKEVSNQPEPKARDKFQRPELPITWLISTFVVPVLVAFIPYLIAKDEVSFKTCVIIGLALGCVMLFVFAFYLILRLYDSAFDVQLLQRDADTLKEEMSKFKEEYKKLTLQADELREQIDILLVKKEQELQELEELPKSQL